MSGDFTLRGYAAMVEGLITRGYTLADFTTVRPEHRDLLLRHDVDYSLAHALTMAEAEATRGWRTTYFVLVATEFYNVLSGRGRAQLRRLADLGHTIGLHFDAAVHEGDEHALQQVAAEEFDVLSQILGQRVEIGSYHRPAPDLLNASEPLAGRMHVTQPRFFSEIGYCSDSRGAWRFAPPEEHRAVQEGRALHLLTHPIWWTTNPGEPAAKLEAWLDGRMTALRDELAHNSIPYREHRGRGRA